MANTASWRPMLEENGKPLIRELVKLIHLIFRTDVSGCGFAGMVGPALSSVQLKAAESKRAWEQLWCSEHEFLPSFCHCCALSLLTSLRCCLPLCAPVFFLTPVLWMPKQQNWRNIKLVSCRNELKRQSSKSGGGSQAEGELSARGAVSHRGFSCLRSCAPGCCWQCQAAGTEGAGLISQASLTLALLPAASGIHVAK